MNTSEVGWYWRFIGLLLLIFAMGLAGFKLVVTHEFSMTDVFMNLALIFAALVILRPDWMDKHFKELLDRLPFVPYQKPAKATLDEEDKDENATVEKPKIGGE